MNNGRILKILIVGGDSFIGKGLVEDLKKDGHYVTSTSRRKVDQTKIYLDLENISEQLNNIDHDVMIICAGVTKFADCEENQKVNQVNYESIKDLVRISNNYKSKLIYLSSPAVSAKSIVKNEYHPIGTYGFLKKKSEEYIRQNSQKYIIARIGKVFEGDGELLNQWVIDLDADRKIYAFDNHLVPYVSFETLKKILHHISILEKYSNNTVSIHCKPKSYFQIANILCQRMNLDCGNIIKTNALEKIKKEMILTDFQQLNNIKYFGKYKDEIELNLIFNTFLDGKIK